MTGTAKPKRGRMVRVSQRTIARMRSTTFDVSLPRAMEHRLEREADHIGMTVQQYIVACIDAARLWEASNMSPAYEHPWHNKSQRFLVHLNRQNMPFAMHRHECVPGTPFSKCKNQHDTEGWLDRSAADGAFQRDPTNSDLAWMDILTYRLYRKLNEVTHIVGMASSCALDHDLDIVPPKINT